MTLDDLIGIMAVILRYFTVFCKLCADYVTVMLDAYYITEV